MCAEDRDRAWLERAAQAIAEGGDIAWPGGDAPSGTDAQLLRCVRIISDIAAASRESSAEDSASTNREAPETVAPVNWGPLVVGPLLGRGSFGDVYRAFDPRLGREVALKLLRSADAPRSRFSDARLVEEGRLLARVRHPNVAVVYGADEIDGRLGVWMELVHGRTLEDELQARGPFDAIEAASIAVEVCGALEAVHAAGVVHRDVKAHNVLRETSGRIVLTDFGTGCEQGALDAQVAGTLPYLAPELFQGGRASPQSDVYSVGVLLFHLLTRSYPVSGATVREVRESHTHGTRQPLDELRHQRPRRLVAVVARALAASPADRFQSAADMGLALRHFLAAPRKPRRRLLSYTSLAVVAIVVVAALLFAHTDERRAAGVLLPPGTHTFANRASIVTTRSPEARVLYEQAVALLEPGRYEQAQAEALLRRAIAFDPTFASAHIMLAFALDNQGKPLEATLPIVDRSRELERNASEAERLFIEGSAELLNAHPEAAIASYDALVRIAPTHYWAVNNLAVSYRWAGRQEDALPYFARAADLRPGVVDPQVTAAARLCAAGHFAEAQAYASRATRLVARGFNGDRASLRWLAFYPVFERWRADDIDGAEAELARVVAAHRGELWEDGAGGENMLSEFAGDWYLTLGQLRKAKAMYATAPINPDVENVYQAYWARAAGDFSLFRRGIRRWYSAVGPRKVNWWTSGMLAQAGWVQEARNSLDGFDEEVRKWRTGDMPITQAIEHYMEGEIAAATGHLQGAYKDFDFALHRMPHSWRFAPLRGMTDVLERRHTLGGATTILEQTLPRRAIYSEQKVFGADWLQLESRLADLYCETGREADAARIEAELRRLLAHADRNHPILVHIDRVHRPVMP